VDQSAREISRFVGEVPAGILTSVFSVPLLLWLLSRQRAGGIRPARAGIGRRIAPTWRLIAGVGLLLLLLLPVALFLAPVADGWHWSSLEQLQPVHALWRRSLPVPCWRPPAC